MKKKSDKHASRKGEETPARIAQEWQETFDAVLDAIWILDKDQRIIRCNKAAQQMFNVSREEMTGKYCWEIVHGTAQPSSECPLLRVKKSFVRESMELAVDSRWFAVHVDPILGGPGDITGYVHIVNDITERKQAEDALRKSEDNYRTIFENSAEGMFQVTPEGKFINANPALARSLGYDSREELLGAITDISWQIYVDSNEREALRALLKKDGFVNNFMVQCRKKDGGIVWIQINLRLVKDQNGKILFHEGTGRDVTERKQAENELRESEERFAKAFKTSPYAYVIANMEDGRIVEVNDAFTTISGFTRQEALANSTLSLKIWVNEEDRQQMVATLRDGQAVRGLETKLRGKHGNVKPVLLFAQVVHLSNRSCILSIVEDITERKQAEEAMRKAQQQIADALSFNRMILDSSPVGMLVYKASGECVSANQAAARIIGGTTDELLAQNFRNLATWKRDGLLECADRALTKGNPVPKEIRSTSSFGKTVCFTTSFTPFSSVGEKHLLFLIQDISERKQVEESLRESEEKYRTLVDHANQVVIVAQDDLIKFVNRKGIDLWGYSEQESMSKPFLEFVHPEDRHLIIENHARLMKGDLIQQRYEFRIMTADGRVRWVEINPVPIEWKGRAGTLNLLTDITEQKRIEETLQKAQKLDSLGVLAGGIAHDFNNLLTGIFGYLDLARSSSRDAKTTEYLEATLTTMNRARALTLQLLTFAKGGFPLQKITPLTPFIQDTAHFALSGSNISRKFSLSENLWPCNIDKDQIAQVIDNIVINAQQAMPNGGDLEITAENISFGEKEHPPLARGDYVRVSIEDHGIGMPKDVLPRIFDPFYTTKTKGHGLGLATCYSIITRHEGCIDVESEQGKGSTFHVYLPASPESAVVEAAAIVHHKGSGTIIVMDDEEVIRETLRQILGAMGYTVVCKNDGRAAVDFYMSETKAGHKFAAMIFDLTVPGGMGGIEAVKEVRKLDAGAEIPVFVASGYADDPVITNPVEYGFTASISKPFTMAELSEMLNKNIR